MHKKDKAILELFQSKWGVGIIGDKDKNAVRFIVTRLKDIKVVIDHAKFDKNPLVTQKLADYR